VTESLVRRATSAGYGAIVVTVDVPMLGRRERDLRNVFAVPPGQGFGNFSAPPPDPGPERSAVARWFGWIQSPALSWDDIAWLRTLTPLPLVLKGVLRADDATRAAQAGIAAIWVSNHGGRQLDGARPAIDALAEIREAVPGTPLIVDGGVRRGTDVLKALALGASAVAIGRPQLWGLAADGQAGVRRVLELLRDELSQAMGLAGCRSIGEIGPDLIA
jgi:4-hydroxymandelate oxidase